MLSVFALLSRRWLPMLSALLLTAGLLSVAAPASAVGAPRGLAPRTGTTSLTPVLRWRPVRGATGYTVQVAENRSFTSVVFDLDTANTSAVPYDQLPVGRLWWRVRAVKNRTASRWATASFVRTAPAGPTLVAPGHGASLAQPQSPPLLRWNPVAGAERYRIEIDTAERDWVETRSFTTETAAFVVPPQQPGTYWWRVRAELDGGIYTRVSAPRSYTVRPLPRLGPGDAGLVDDFASDPHVEDVVFDWKPVAGAVSYDIRVSTDDDFNTIVDSRAVKGTRYSPMQTYDNAHYWWQVRSRDIFGQAQEWNTVPVRTFQRAWLEKPQLVWPENADVVGDDFYFQWQPVRKAARYRIDVGPDPNFSSGFTTCYTTQTTYTPGFAKSPTDDACMPAPGERTFWRVQALDHPAGVNGVISDVREFHYDPGLVRQTSPVEGAAVAVPTLTWEPATDAVSYLVKLRRPDGQVIEAETYSFSWTYTGRSRLPAGEYRWTVQAVDRNGGLSPRPLDERRFTLTSFEATGEALAPTSPAGPWSRFPALTWGAHPDADYYRVYLANQGSSFFQDLGISFPYPAGTDEASQTLRAGTYDFRVQAFADNAPLGNPGPTGTFTISDLAPATGQRVALDGSGLDAGTGCSASLASGTVCDDTRATPVLDWESVEGAGFYLVYLSRDKNLTNLVYGNKADPSTLPRTQSSRWTPPVALSESQAGGAYYWAIRPCKTGSACAPDPTEATHAFRKKSNAVELLSPADGATGANDVTFTWTDFLATNRKAAGANPETGERPGQAARTYRVQVADNPTFTRPFTDILVDQTTYTPYSKTFPEGTLYWRVQAVDGSDNGLAWSPTRTLVKRSPSPALSYPASGSVVGNTPPFSWQPLNFAASYEVEVYKNGDRNASTSNRVVRATSRQPAYAHTRVLPASPKPYVWRVRRLDADKRAGAWSGWRTFTVRGAAPRQVSPRPGARVPKHRALLAWAPTAGATDYQVQLRRNGRVRYWVRTAATAWAPRRVLDRGVWEWRVIANDADGAPLQSSPWRRFVAR